MVMMYDIEFPETWTLKQVQTELQKNGIYVTMHNLFLLWEQKTKDKDIGAQELIESMETYEKLNAQELIDQSI